MVPLIFDKSLCKQMVQYAEANPLSFTDLQNTDISIRGFDCTLYTKKFTAQNITIAFTIEELEDGEYSRHISINPLIALPETKAILAAFGINWNTNKQFNEDSCLAVSFDRLNDTIDFYFDYPGYSHAEQSDCVNISTKVGCGF